MKYIPRQVTPQNNISAQRHVVVHVNDLVNEQCGEFVPIVHRQSIDADGEGKKKRNYADKRLTGSTYTRVRTDTRTDTLTATRVHHVRARKLQ
jgi:hypothetical protein